MDKFQRDHITIIEAAGGRVSNGKFVEKPGVMLVMDHNGITTEVRQLMKDLRMNIDQDPYLLIGELGARLTYLSFPKELATVSQSQGFHQKMIHDHGHLSPYNISAPSILFAGIASETALEIVSHRGDVARLTTSKTKAMNNPLYRVMGDPNQIEIQKRLIFALESAKELIDTTGLTDEMRNMMNPGTKATSLINSMNVRDWHWVLRGRLSEYATVETELVEILERVCDELRKSYSHIIQTANQYKGI